MPTRVVLDTNQLIAALTRPPQLATFLMAWESRRFTIIASKELLDEYDYVLQYPEIASLIEPELLRMYRTHLFDEIEPINLPDIPQLCRDPDDDKVIATAIHGQVDFLVTEDGDLKTASIKLALAESGIEVISLRELMVRIDQ